MVYPKEVLGASGKNSRRDFFNLAISMKNDSDVRYIYKCQFLLQSCVVLIDEELVGWLFKFIEKFASKIGSSLTGIHPALDKEKGVVEILSPSRMTEYLLAEEDQFEFTA